MESTEWGEKCKEIKEVIKNWDFPYCLWIFDEEINTAHIRIWKMFEPMVIKAIIDLAQSCNLSLCRIAVIEELLSKEEKRKSE